MIVRGRIYASMNFAKGPPLAVNLLPIRTFIATHPSALVSVYVLWRLWVEARPALRLEHSRLEYPSATRKI